MSFRDDQGNILPNSWDSRSENPLTFTASFYFSALFNNKNNALVHVYVFKTKFLENNREWRTMENDPNPSWSIDEKISALAYFSWKEDSRWLSYIPLFPTWKNSSKWSWFRPDVLAYTIGSKCKVLRILMWPIVLFKIYLSMREFKKDPLRESSGVQLAFIKAMGWGKVGWVNENKNEIKRAIDIYYPEKEHPTREVWK